MTFSIGLGGPEDEDLAEYFFQCFGRALCVATLFEQKCSWVSWIGQTVHEIRQDPNFKIRFKEPDEPDDKPPRLHSSINALLKVVSSESAEELALLHKGREARNKIAHDLSDVGPLGGLRSRHMKQALDALRIEVETLAEADAVASSWAYAIQVRENAPSWLRENYPRRLVCCDDQCKLRYKSETRVQCARGHLFDLHVAGADRTITVATAGPNCDVGTAVPVPPHVTFQ